MKHIREQGKRRPVVAYSKNNAGVIQPDFGQFAFGEQPFGTRRKQDDSWPSRTAVALCNPWLAVAISALQVRAERLMGKYLHKLLPMEKPEAVSNRPPAENAHESFLQDGELA